MTDYMNQYKRNLKAMNNSGKGTPQPGEIWWVSRCRPDCVRPVLLGLRGELDSREGEVVGKNESDDWPVVDSAEDVIRGLRKHRNPMTFELCQECRTPCVYEEIRNAGGGKGRRRR